MANTPQARKRARQNVTRRVRNHAQRTGMRTAIKKFLAAVKAGESDAAKSAYRDASSLIDKTARRGLQHRSKADRLKSRLNTRLKDMTA